MSQYSFCGDLPVAIQVKQRTDINHRAWICKRDCYKALAQHLAAVKLAYSKFPVSSWFIVLADVCLPVGAGYAILQIKRLHVWL
ncbi:hypothetical protein CCP3SC15_2650005 [Gammaproteobacteria bacterium]